MGKCGGKFAVVGMTPPPADFPPLEGSHSHGYNAEREGPFMTAENFEQTLQALQQLQPFRVFTVELHGGRRL